MGSFIIWNYTVFHKNESRVFLNIFYSCKSIAIKFSKWYTDGISYKMHKL